MNSDQLNLHFCKGGRNKIWLLYIKINIMFNKLIAAILPWFPKKFIWMFSRPYIAGETLSDAIRVSSSARV